MGKRPVVFDHSQNQMVSTAQKIEALRMATAQACLQVKPETLVRIRSNDLPKQDVLVIARAAGVLAAKQTPHLLPFCHPLMLDQIQVDFELSENAVTVLATVSTVAKTGVEMEALMAANIAALTLYDMLKPIDDALVISDVRLRSKFGGKQTYRVKIPQGFKSAVIVASDSTAAGQRKDKSGQIIRTALVEYGLPEPEYYVLPDEKTALQTLIRSLAAQQVQLILCSGGTGLGPRDVTVEAVAEMVERTVPGIAEAMRAFGQKHTPYAMLSRGIAGVLQDTLIITLPGSSAGAAESLAAIFPYILHAFPILRGANHDSGEQGQNIASLVHDA